MHFDLCFSLMISEKHKKERFKALYDAFFRGRLPYACGLVRVRHDMVMVRNPVFFNAERSIPPGILAGESEHLTCRTSPVQQSSSGLTTELL